MSGPNTRWAEAPVVALLVRYLRRMSASRPATWLRHHPMIADAILVGVLAAIAMPSPFLATEPSRAGDAVAAILVAAETIPLIWRRSNPDITLAVVGGATLAYYAAGYGSQPAWAALVVASYSFGAHRRTWPQLWAVGALTAEFAASFATRPTPKAPTTVAGISVGACVAFVVAWAAGEILRSRRHEAARLAHRAELAEADRETQARRAVAAERSRIARELHDVVAHALGVIVMQAGGAARVADLDPALARDIFRSIEHAGRQAFAEMRRLVDVLREDDLPAERSPQPSIGDLTSLIAQFADAGLPVSLTVEGQPANVGAGIGLAVYRIVQEALTNTLKHAGPGVPSQILLVWHAHDLQVDVSNDAAGIRQVDHAQLVDSGGHGLIGMRERVALYGGEMHAGRREGGGFRVHATIPFPHEAGLLTPSPASSP